LIIRKVSKFDANRCQILRLKCIKFHYRWCDPLQTQLGSLERSLEPLTVFQGPTSKERAGRGKGKGRGKEGKGGRGKEGPAPKYFGLEPPLNREIINKYKDWNPICAIMRYTPTQ